MKHSFIIIVIVGLLLYLPSLFGPFLWDDEDFVYANQYVKDFRIDKFFTDSQTAGRGKISNYYRPLPQTVYATTNVIFGMTPFWYHLLNVLVHIGAACAIFAFLKIFLSERKNDGQNITTPLLTSLIFLIHPVQTEAVSYVSGLSDPLFVLFGFLSLIYFLKTKLWWSLGFFTLSIFSKETGLVFLPLLILLSFLPSFPKFPKPFFLAKKLWTFLAVATTYLWYHFTFINSFDMKSAWGNNPYANSLLVRLLTFIQNFFTYIGLLLFPKDLFMERDYTVEVQTQLLNPYLIAFIGILISLVILLYKKRTDVGKFKTLTFFSLGFFICFIPYTGIVLINGIFYEHFLYLPLVFFFAFFGVLFEKYLKNKYVLYLVIAVLILFGTRNIIRQFDWNNSIRFYSKTLERAPKSARILNGLGMAHAENGNFEESIQAYKRGIKENPSVPNFYHNLANVYAAQGNIVKAEENFLKALEVDPNFLFSAQSLANLYQQTNQKEKLEQLLVKYTGH